MLEFARKLFASFTLVCLLTTISIGLWLLPVQQVSETVLYRIAVAACLAIVFLSFLQLLLNTKLSHRIKELKNQDLMLKKLSNAVTNSGASIIITDSFGRVEFVNEKFVKTTGFQRQDIEEKFITTLSPGTPADRLGNWSQAMLQEGWEGEVLCRRASGGTFWTAISVSIVRDSDNTISNFIISGIDISELKQANNQMEKIALYDALTGLANRRLFIDRLEQALRAAHRDQKKIALLFLDLDKFKRINDTLGHDAGDELLETVAKRLKHCVREKDTVARLGGDEFTVLLTDVEEDVSVSHVAQNILGHLKDPIRLKKHEVIVSTSIGITLAPDDSNTADRLMKNADLALYRAKEHGRDCYHFFTEELNEHALRQLELEQELRHALQYDEFTLYFQPQIDLRTEALVSVEALLRWHHPQRGLVMPQAFISVAEETGLIVPIGQWVLRNACHQTKMLQDLTGYPVKVAINLSARQFDDPGLESFIGEVIQESGLNPQHVELEVTESMLMGDIEAVIRKLEKLKTTGISITIDDFGSGYSSLRYLKKLPVDVLKVDREFVRDIPDDINDMEITSAVIAVAHKLNLKVIAEGVEDIDQRDFLIINNCDYAQGYLYSQPLAFEALYDYIRKPIPDASAAVGQFQHPRLSPVPT